ncbi:MAG: segregation ATPase FtsK/SpoIIIE, family, partial [Solirubrobacteraceae bacterium]|nr:segregation ATPase FtsK/SpoIIIE, family [Solirubrobacteraceae bacterium]
MAPARKPASRRPPATPSAKPAAGKSRPRARAQRSSLGALGLPVLAQRHLDLIGLGLVALGVFLAFPLYLGWDGGAAGQAATRGLAYAVGQVAYAVPVAIVAAGALFVLRPVLPTMRPFRAGALCLFAALTLMLAAGTFGIGPAGARDGYWEAAFFEPRGGIAGEALLWAVASAVSTIGAHILAVFLFVAGVLLLTGASVAGVLRTTGSGLADTTRAIGRVVAVPARRPRRTATPPAPEDGGAPEDVADEAPFAVPEPEEGEMIVRATHVEAPPPRARPPGEGSIVGRPGFWSGATRFPDIYGEPLPGPGEPDAARIAEDEHGEATEPEQLAFDETEPEAEADPDVTAVLPRRRVAAEDLTPQGRLRGSVTEDPEFQWRLPSVNLLRRSSTEQLRPDTAGQEKTAARLIEALGHFGVEAKIVGTVAGPHITRFELRLAPGIKMSKVAQLKDDLAYALAATDIRILAPIPGKTAVGVEVPNQRRRIVQLGDVYQDAPRGWSPLTVWLGKDVGGKAIGADLAKMPHLLVAGTTGAGKSGAINAMLSSLLLRATPHELRLVLIDPKQVELNHYESIPHLLTPVITSPRMAANALQNLVREMEQRYSVMSLAKTRSLIELNRAKAKRGEPPLPYILCVIDELADLMMVAPADVEDSIIRLAQKARAVGIHLVLATQSPRVDVITGMIKANVPSRIAFSVSSQTDSRVILDVNGAESLLG